MSFTLKSIELKNIRAHEHILFEPALEGITAISGDNGAGKSTIVDAFAWGLYGTRPSGVRNKNLIKDGVDPKEKPVSVKSILIIGGIEYAIERKIITAQGAVECNVWGKKPGSDKFTQVAGPAVSHVEKFVRNELGMNENGFLTSVLIQQKQVDQIVSASPRERGAVIEELTGIASITQAIQRANETTRSLEKASSIFRIGNIDEAKDKVEKQESICKDIDDKEELAINQFNDMKNTHKKLKSELSEEQLKVNKRIKLTQEIKSTESQINFLKKQAEDDLSYILNFKNKYGTTIYSDTIKCKEEVELKRNEDYKLKSKINNLNNELKTVIKGIEKSVLLKGKFEDIVTAEKKHKALSKKLSKINKDIEESRLKKSMITSEIKHSEASHEHINGEDKNCPVCKSKIKDPEELRSQIEKDIYNFNKELTKVSNKIKKLIKEESEIAIEIKSVNVSIEAIEEEVALRETKEKLNRELEDLTKSSDLVSEELKEMELEYDKALRIEADKSALDSAKERSLTVNATIDNNQEKVSIALAEIDELNALSDDSLSALIDRVNEAQDKLTKMSIAGRELRGRKTLELERLGDYKSNLKEVEDTVTRYNELAEQIELSSSASAMLSAFKADRIEHSIPTLEFYASDFLSKFTGGTFTKMTVDEKFNTFVTTAEGVLRPVAQLSGGELSSTAIALRLGIAMLLNSSEKNVLILDEVLVSMDEDRSRQIMETIGSMTNSQVIFIAHNSDINSVADKTVLVSK